MVPRNCLEWRCDPASEWRHPAITRRDLHIILICHQGYQSSLPAATLQQLGLINATDLDGGFTAWAAAGLPVIAPAASRPRPSGTIILTDHQPESAKDAPEVGSRCTMTRRIGGSERTPASEITQITPPRTWAIRGVDGPIRADVNATVDPVNDGQGSMSLSGSTSMAMGSAKCCCLWSSGRLAGKCRKAARI